MTNDQKMNRHLQILVSGAVAVGFLTSAKVLARAQDLVAPRIEARNNDRDALLKAARRRQLFNLTNQLRPFYRYELMSVRTGCRLTTEDLRSIRPETDAAFDRAIARLFEAQQKASLAPVQARSADLDYESVIRDAVFSVVRRHVPAERWAVFQADLKRREASRKQAGVEFLVATLDRELRLTGRQRDQLAQSLSAHWDGQWYSALELTIGGNPCVSQIPDELVKPYLSEIQQGIWSRMYKFEGPLWGVALDHGGDPEVEHALGAGPSPEAQGIPLPGTYPKKVSGVK
jgi:hypothetical protein